MTELITYGPPLAGHTGAARWPSRNLACWRTFTRFRENPT